jgi:predicted anti-sigma-YlaC factor YlaD
MHQPITDGLESYLRGERERSSSAFEAHMNACAECREIVSAMREQSELLGALRSPQDVEPPPGFYARVMARIEEQAAAPQSLWALLLDPRLGKRLMYATATLVVLMATYLVSSETAGDDAWVAKQQPEAIMAPASGQQPPALTDDQQRDRDAILVTLATYQE